MTVDTRFQRGDEDLPTIDLQSLLLQDSSETAKLLDAAKKYGFFYLDFRTMPESEKLLGLVDNIYEFQKKLFDLSQQEKMKYDVDKIGGYMKTNGYKPKGRNFGNLANGRDGFESYSIPKDSVLGLDQKPFAQPTIFGENGHMLTSFMHLMQDATHAIHTSLSQSLQLAIGERFEDFHRADHSSPCILRLLKYHAQPAMERGAPQTPHTDLGSLTILFTKQPGLQVLMKEAAEWQYVEPIEGCAIVNIGDGMSMMTHGLLHSSLHRVAPPINQSMATRYSFAYLQRAEVHTPLMGLRSPLIPTAGVTADSLTSGEWLREKFMALRAKTHNNSKEWVLTGCAVEISTAA